MFCSGDSEKQKIKFFKTTPNFSCRSKHWCEIGNEEEVWDSLHPFGVQFKDNTTCDSALNLQEVWTVHQYPTHG